MAEKITSENFEEKILKNNGLILLEFYSDSCIACKRMSPLLAQVEESYGDRILIGKINAAFEQDIAKEYHVMSAPTLLFLKAGQQVARTAGVIKKEDLFDLIESICL